APLTTYPSTGMTSRAASAPRVSVCAALLAADAEGSARINITEGGGSLSSPPGSGPDTVNDGSCRQTRAYTVSLSPSELINSINLSGVRRADWLMPAKSGKFTVLASLTVKLSDPSGAPSGI